MEEKILRYDYDTVASDGSDNVTKTLLALLNSYPGMSDGIANSRNIEFQLLDTNKGIAMFPNPSVAILTEKEDITGHVAQTCAYAFTVVFRTRINASGKEVVKEWLDNLGRWLEKISYPELSFGEFKKIKRTTQSYKYGESEDKAEDWAISLQATYTNEFDKE